MIRFACPKCQQGFKAEDNAAGRKIKCPKCGTAFLVPAAQAAPPIPLATLLPADASSGQTSPTDLRGGSGATSRTSQPPPRRENVPQNAVSRQSSPDSTGAGPRSSRRHATANGLRYRWPDICWYRRSAVRGDHSCAVLWATHTAWRTENRQAQQTEKPSVAVPRPLHAEAASAPMTPQTEKRARRRRASRGKPRSRPTTQPSPPIPWRKSKAPRFSSRWMQRAKRCKALALFSRGKVRSPIF